MPSRRTYGAGLRAVRRAKGLTQLELGQMAGLSQAAVCHLETDPRANPSWETVVKLAYALGTRPEVLFRVPVPFVQQRARRGPYQPKELE